MKLTRSLFFLAGCLGFSLGANASLVAPPSIDYVSCPASCNVGETVTVSVGAHANESDNSDGNDWNGSRLVIARINIDYAAPGGDWVGIYEWLPTWQSPANVSANFTPNAPGTWYVRVRVMDGRPWYTPSPGEYAYYTIQVNNTAAPPAVTMTASPTGVVAPGQVVTFSVNASHSIGLNELGLELCDSAGTPVSNAGAVAASGTTASHDFTWSSTTPGTYYFDTYAWNIDRTQLTRTAVVMLKVEPEHSSPPVAQSIPESALNWDDNIKGLHEMGMWMPYNYSEGQPMPYRALIEKGMEAHTKHNLIAVVADGLILPLGHAPTGFSYSYDGNTYYFEDNIVADLDNKVSEFTARGVKTTAVVILMRGGPDAMYYPAAERTKLDSDGHPVVQVFAFNMDPAGAGYFHALMGFLAHRYTDSSRLISGYVIGNEIQGHGGWYNMGPALDLSAEYVTGEYAKAIEAAWQELAQVNPGLRVFVSMEHSWAEVPSYSHLSGKNFLTLLNQRIPQVPWNVAFHPYPIDLRFPWNDEREVDANAPEVTFKNLEVLYYFLNQSAYRYAGKVRRVILSEQGIPDNGPGSTADERKIQAAAYAYCYLRAARMPNVDAMHWLSFQDGDPGTQAEGARYNGLVPSYPNDNYWGLLDKFGTPKPSYNVYAAADQSNWQSVFEPYKSTIRLNGQPLSDWNDVNPYVVRPVSGSSRLHGLSYRAYVENGKPIIGGFIVRGGTKRVLIRAKGPSMSEVPNHISNPFLKVFSESALIGSNDDWGNAAEIADASSQIHLIPLQTSESAMLLDLPAGNYTTHVETQGDPGIAIVEIYEVNSDETPRLFALSARAEVRPDIPNGIGIGGVAISGTGTQNLICRAVGPSMALPPYNLSGGGLLADPTMTVYHGGTIIAQNDNWSSALNAEDTTTYTSRVGLAQLPDGSADSALFMRVYPGDYTIHVNSPNGQASGNAIMEIYDAN